MWIRRSGAYDLWHVVHSILYDRRGCSYGHENRGYAYVLNYWAEMVFSWPIPLLNWLKMPALAQHSLALAEKAARLLTQQGPVNLIRRFYCKSITSTSSPNGLIGDPWLFSICWIPFAKNLFEFHYAHLILRLKASAGMTVLAI